MSYRLLCYYLQRFLYASNPLVVLFIIALLLVIAGMAFMPLFLLIALSGAFILFIALAFFIVWLKMEA